MSPGCKWLAVIDGATHLDLGGRGGAPLIEDLTVQTIRAFLRGVRFDKPTGHPRDRSESS